MRLSLLHRIGLLILAVLPVAWGNCPGWFGGRGGCGASATAGPGGDAHARTTCPCCEKRSREGRPLRGCEDCPIVAVRRTASPVPPGVVLPPPVLLGLVTAPRLDGADGSDGAAPRILAPSPPGGPPGLVGIVVLVV